MSKIKIEGDCAFSVAGPRIWNSLPLFVRSATSAHKFKFKLQSYHFTLAFHS